MEGEWTTGTLFSGRITTAEAVNSCLFSAKTRVCVNALTRWGRAARYGVTQTRTPTYLRRRKNQQMFNFEPVIYRAGRGARGGEDTGAAEGR
ncbi:hypothetical protein EVAR_19175_1 [Eumeta japonica]|uniref:Uncharacterized protein n=1 Tax=Eumeta variegata TaxID=151549 RepID=A0A4C1VLW5_EUMVA|nr:hypothetical protein EVAR_19175_1 [Eumeta japonica]